jgi:hypothetical protein
MGCIRVERITEYLCEPLARCLRDEDPYVRKTAAVCVAKLYDISAELVEVRRVVDLEESARRTGARPSCELRNTGTTHASQDRTHPHQRTRLELSRRSPRVLAPRASAPPPPRHAVARVPTSASPGGARA